MRPKFLFLALLLSALPGLAAAAGCGHARETTSVCADGQIWDGASQTCITPVSS